MLGEPDNERCRHTGEASWRFGARIGLGGSDLSVPSIMNKEEQKTTTPTQSP